MEWNHVTTEQEQAEAAIAQEMAQEKERANSEAGQGESHEGGSPTVEESCEEAIQLPPILLMYNGHGSHTTLDWVTLAHSNNIILFCLPPHTTHRLQPLDVGCFGLLQTAWFN
jgi:hypothetical protein